MADRVEFSARDNFTPILKKIAEQAKKLDIAFDEIKERFVQVDASGKVTKATITGITTEGEKLVGTLNRLKSGAYEFKGALDLTKNSIVDNINQLRVLLRERAKLDLAESEVKIGSRQTQDFFRRRLSSEEQLATGATRQELTAYAEAKAALLDYVKTGQVEYSRLRDIFVRLEADKRESSTRTLTEIEQAVKKVIDAERALGDESSAAIAKSRRERSELLQVFERQRLEVEKLAQAERDAANAQRSRSIEAEKVRREIQRGLTEKDIFAKGATPQEYFNLKQAESALISFVAQNNISANKVKSIWSEVSTNSFKGYRNELSTLQSKLYDLVKAQRAVGSSAAADMAKTTTAVKTSNKSVQDLLLSWKSLERIVVVQLLRRALFSFTNALRDSINEAIELSKRISELQTISQEAQLTTEQWTKGVTDLSNAFGLSIQDVTGAAYETLSNQIAKGAETFDFLATAAKFSITTLTSVTDSVNLLTAALNAYGKDASEAESVAASLFTTIDLGRVRGEELANTFGRITILGSQLGISLEELEAFLTILTIRGVSASEAMTQIRGVLTKLIRPTEEMKKAFRELGVASAEELFRSYNLVEVFQLLYERTGGTSTELGKLFPRVRAISGAIVGATTAGTEFTETLDKIRNSSERFRKATEYVLQSSGKIVETEFQKIKNLFTVTFGTTIIDSLAFINEHIVSLSTAVRYLSEVILTALVPATIVLLGLFTKLIIANPFTASIAALAIAATAAYEIGKSLREADIDSQEAVTKAIKARVKAAIEQEKALSRAIENEINKRQRVEEKAFSAVIGELNISADKQVEIIEDLNKVIKDNFNNTLSGLREAVKDFDSDLKGTVKNLEDLLKFQADITKDIKEQIFDESLDRLENVRDKLLLYQKEIDETQKRIELAVATGDSTAFQESVRDLKRLVQARIQLTREAQKEREKVAGEITEKEAKLELDLAELREKADLARRQRNFKQAQKFEQKEADLRRKRDRDIDKERKRLTDLQNQDIDYFADNYEQQYNAILVASAIGTEVLQQQQLQRALELAEKESAYRILLKKQELAAEEYARYKPKDLLEAETPEEIRKVGEARLQNIQGLIDITKELIAVNSSESAELQLQSLLKEQIATKTQLAATYDAKQLDISRKQSKESIDNLKKLNEELSKNRQKLKTAKETLDTIRTTVETSKIEAELIKQSIFVGYRLPKGEPTVVPIIEQFEAAKKTFEAFKEFQRTGSAESIMALSTATDELAKHLEDITLLGLGTIKIPGLVEFFQIADQTRRFAEGFNIARTSADQLTAKLSETEDLQNQIVEAIKVSKQEQADLNRGKEKELSLTEKILKALVDYHNIRASGAELRESIMPFARGGAISSTDTINALLSPGEFVVNSKASRRFYSQLVGMNSGFARGGSTNTTNVGDIHIHGFQPSGSVDSDVINLGKRLRRQIRRGTVRLS